MKPVMLPLHVCRTARVGRKFHLKVVTFQVFNWLWFVMAFTAFFLCSSLPTSAQSSPLTEILQNYATANNFETKYNHLVWNVVRDSLERTSYRGKVTINSTAIRADSINIFILAKDPDRYFSQIECNCRYIGELQAIICDHALLDYLATLLHWEDADVSSEESQSFYVNAFSSEFLLHWVLAHEIGHVMRGSKAFSYFQGGAHSPIPSAKIDPSEEIAADDFAAESIRAPEQQKFAWLMVDELINSLYIDGLKKQAISSGGKETAVDQLDDLIFKEAIHLTIPDTGDPHPPWLVRALHFEELLREKYPKTVFDKTGYYPKMIKSITVSAGRTQPSSLCHSGLDIHHQLVFVKLPKPVLNDYDFHKLRTLNLFELAQFRPAINEVNEWIAILPKSEKKMPEDLALPYTMRGIAEVAIHDYHDAVANFETTLKYTPNDADVRNDLAFSYFEVGRRAPAVDQWRLSLKLKPDLADAWAGLGVAYFLNGQRNSGLMTLKHALSLEPLYASPDYLRYEAFWSERQIALEQKMIALLHGQESRSRDVHKEKVIGGQY